MAILEEAHVLAQQVIEQARLHARHDLVAGARQDHEITVGRQATQNEQARHRPGEQPQRAEPLGLDHAVQHGLQQPGRNRRGHGPDGHQAAGADVGLQMLAAMLGEEAPQQGNGAGMVG